MMLATRVNVPTVRPVARPAAARPAVAARPALRRSVLARAEPVGAIRIADAKGGALHGWDDEGSLHLALHLPMLRGGRRVL
jgi:hypothetical protein